MFNYSELHLCCSQLIHTFVELILALCPRLCLRSSMNIVLWCGRCILCVNISWDLSGSIGEFATSAMTWPQRWKTSCCHGCKFLPVITSSCTLFFSPAAIFQIARPSSWRPTLALKWRNTALISCLALTGECKNLLVIDAGRPTHFRRSRSCEKSLERRALSTVIGCQTVVDGNGEQSQSCDCMRGRTAFPQPFQPHFI